LRLENAGILIKQASCAVNTGFCSYYFFSTLMERIMHIEQDDLSRPQIHALLEEHLQSMRAQSPPESVHALDLGSLRAPDITFWSIWDGSILLGCGALKQLDSTHGEIKSMRTPSAQRRRGAGRAMLMHIVEEARGRGYRRLSLETGSQATFQPAQQLYQSIGFTPCPPFGSYRDDPNSVYLSLQL
jgi:putative acetyltransferase